MIKRIENDKLWRSQEMHSWEIKQATKMYEAEQEYWFKRMLKANNLPYTAPLHTKPEEVEILKR